MIYLSKIYRKIKIGCGKNLVRGKNLMIYMGHFNTKM
jgi:hypothetical protein